MDPASADTIVAVATPSGVGAIAVLRLSGALAVRIARSLAPSLPAEPESHRAYRCRLRAEGDTLDDAIVLVFRSPRSFTGEDVVELQCHGGSLTVRRVFRATIAAGARPAEPGEFARRALLNGKLDLIQAESIADLIEAESEAAHRLAIANLDGRLSVAIDALKANLTTSLALVEAAIDFATEEHVYSITGLEIAERVAPVLDGVRALMSTYDAGRLTADGVRVAIVGSPNAGKSSLLNHLVRADRALVTEHPGTTRDTIEEAIEVEGVRFLLVDTAGIRRTDDPVESLGIERSRRALAASDVAVLVADCTADLDPELIAALPGRPWALLRNKSDLTPAGDTTNGVAVADAVSVLSISLARGDGLEALDDLLLKLARAAGWQRTDESPIVARERHRALLEACAAALERGVDAALADVGHELVALELREALDALGALTGAVTSDDVLNAVFGEFCIGK